MTETKILEVGVESGGEIVPLGIVTEKQAPELPDDIGVVVMGSTSTDGGAAPLQEDYSTDQPQSTRSA